MLGEPSKAVGGKGLQNGLGFSPPAEEQGLIASELQLVIAFSCSSGFIVSGSEEAYRHSSKILLDSTLQNSSEAKILLWWFLDLHLF